jgi:hypothetical protein
MLVYGSSPPRPHTPSTILQKQVLTPNRCIGAKSTDPAIARKVTLDYALSAVNAFSTLPKPASQPFRFVFTSGILAVREGKSIYFPYGKEARRVGVSLPFPLLLLPPPHPFHTISIFKRERE